MVIKIFWLPLVLCFFGSSTFAKDVVVILSEANELQLKDGKKASTGVYLNELMIPVMELIKRKQTLVFASPTGKPPTFDVASDHAKYFGNDQKKHLRARELVQELKLAGPKASLLSFSELNKKNPKDIAGIFVPGGHAPVTDLASNQELGVFLGSAHKNNIPTALICHGPIAILSGLSDPPAYLSALSAGDTKKAKDLAAGWIYAGYKMTIFSTAEEKIAEEKKLKGMMFYYPEDALKTAGGVLSNASAGVSNIVQDRELMTGQNPASAEEFALTLADFLESRSNKAREGLSR